MISTVSIIQPNSFFFQMNRIANLHNKTQELSNNELPYNPSNVLLQKEDVQAFFHSHGLKGLSCHNINIYRNAFVHRSYCTMKNDDFHTGNERCPVDCLPLQEMSYERLEFIGDAILGMVTATYLYQRYPDQAEGFLSQLRTKLVNGKMLGYLSGKIGFPKFVIMSKQIEEIQGRQNYKINEDVFEAFIGAIYIDYNDSTETVQFSQELTSKGFFPLSGTGYHVAEQWIITIFETYLDFAELIQTKNNFKNQLVSYMLHTYQDSPRFFEMGVHMEQNHKVFTYCVKDKNGLILGKAKGATKKEAENLASKEALGYYGQKLL